MGESLGRLLKASVDSLRKFEDLCRTFSNMDVFTRLVVCGGRPFDHVFACKFTLDFSINFINIWVCGRDLFLVTWSSFSRAVSDVVVRGVCGDNVS